MTHPFNTTCVNYTWQNSFKLSERDCLKFDLKQIFIKFSIDTIK